MWSTTIKTKVRAVTEKVAAEVKAGTGSPGQRSARTKIELCNDIGKSTFPYGKTTGHRHKIANGPNSTKQSGLQSGCFISVCV